ncbi:MAG: hypothetical protein Ta2A_15050 [Treponemataceae bacterium]|nr:MAG: hypothetical protein Ta2A_15050 [Treponemataceae bacterium]
MNTRKLRTSFLTVISVALLMAFSACNSLVQAKLPNLKGNGNGNNNDLELTGLFYAIDGAHEDAVSFDSAPAALNYRLTVEDATSAVWINAELSEPGVPIVYRTVDVVASVTSEKLETTGMVQLDVSTKPETNLYLYIGSKTYTIHILKNEPGAVVYVSPAGDGSGNNDDDNGHRGLTPSTAFYSLHKAIEKATGPGGYHHVKVLGVLKQDIDFDGSDYNTSVFRITSTDKERLVISGAKAGQYEFVEPGLSAEGSANAADGNRAKRVLHISGGAVVELRGLTITDSGKKNASQSYSSFAEKGAGILATGAGTSVTLRAVTVTGNTAQDSGGGIYVGGANVELAELARVYENNVKRGVNYGTSVYYDSGALLFTGNGAALRVDTSASAINDATLGKVPDTVCVAGSNIISVETETSPLIASSTYYGLAAYIVLSTEKYADGTPVLQGTGITGAISNNRFMRFRSYGGARLWAINESGELAASKSFYVKASGGSDYYDGLSPDTAFNSLECALAYTNAAKNQDSYINRKLTVLSELSGLNHTALRYPGIASSGNPNGTPALFNITFDGKTPNKDGALVDAPALLCTVDILITATENTRFACNFTDAFLTFRDITLYRSTYTRSLIFGETSYGEGDVVPGIVTATDVVFSDNVQVGGTFAGTAIINTAADKPVFFRRVFDELNIKETTKYFVSAKCDVTVRAGQLNFMGMAQSITLNGGVVTDEFNSVTDESQVSNVYLKGGKLIVKKPFVTLVHKYHEGVLSFEGGYIPDGAGRYGIVLYGDVGVLPTTNGADAYKKGIETHAIAAYLDDALLIQKFIAKIYLDRGGVEKPRGYKIFNFANLVGGSDAALLTDAGKTIADIAALYPIETEQVRYEWGICTDARNWVALGYLGRTFATGDIIYHERTWLAGPPERKRANENWTPFPNGMVETQSVVYKVDGGTVWKAMYWGLLVDDNEPTNHDSDEEGSKYWIDQQADGSNWYGGTGDAGRADWPGERIPGGSSFYEGGWLIPKETDASGMTDSFGGANPGTNNIRRAEWDIIKTGLGIEAIASQYTLEDGNEGFWTEASMGRALAMGGISLGGSVSTSTLWIILIALTVTPQPSFSWLIPVYMMIGTVLLTAGNITVGGMLAGDSFIEMIYKPYEDDYEISDDNDEQWIPTIVIQRFDNYICYDPEPWHAKVPRQW